MVRNQIERLKKDLRNLEYHEQRMIKAKRFDCIKGIEEKKQYLENHITQLEEAA